MMSDAQDQAAKAWDTWMKMWTSAPNAAAPAAVQDATQAWQQAVQSSWEQLAQNDAFLTTMGKAMAASFEVRETVDKAIEQQLKNMGLPTATDVVGLRKRLRQLDDRMEDLAEAIEGIQADPQVAKRLEIATQAATRAAEAAAQAAEAALTAAAALQKATAALEAAAAAHPAAAPAEAAAKNNSKRGGKSA